jgi:hypothetical protein
MRSGRESILSIWPALGCEPWKLFSKLGRKVHGIHQPHFRDGGRECGTAANLYRWWVVLGNREIPSNLPLHNPTTLLTSFGSVQSLRHMHCLNLGRTNPAVANVGWYRIMCCTLGQPKDRRLL